MSKLKRSVFSGDKKDNVLTGTDRSDILLGKKGNDILYGEGGDDFLFGGKGNDELFGGKGNDKLFGGKGNDFLDGGAGNDYLFGGKGDDTFNFTASENIGAKNYYDGGKGNDTLLLTLTSAQYEAAKTEIAQFEAIGHSCKDFNFESLGLTVRNIENVEFEIVGGGNTPPVAGGGSFTLNEDTKTVLPVQYSDADGDPLTVIVTQPGHGAVEVNADGSFSYTPAQDYFGPDEFTYQVNDGTALSNVATVSLTINSVNDLPVAVDDLDVTALANVVMPDRIKVAVLGVANFSTHVAAKDQLDGALFSAEAIDYTDVILGGWGARLSGFDVVVLGAAETNDYGATTDLFAALNTFVSTGGGVVTTGWFAQALSVMDPAIQGLADVITPITPAGRSYSSNEFGPGTPPSPNDTITVDPTQIPNEITGSIGTFQSGGKFGWELALGVDSGVGVVRLADGVAGNRDNPGDFGTEYAAIVYATNVGRDDAAGLPGGNTVYLGGMYVASTAYATAATRGPDQDAIFEQAIAWAAGGRGAPTATVKIDHALLLANDFDVETARTDLIINFVALQNDSGASIALDANGDVVYTPSAEGLQQLLAGQDIKDSFNYGIIDTDGGASELTAMVNFTVTGFTTDTLL